MEETDKIAEGAFLVARKIFTSELWLKKPSAWKVIFVYILGKVNHKKPNGFERGTGYFNFTEEKRNIGIDSTTDKIKKFLYFARESKLISTTRSTRGMTVNVLNYSKYQDLDNYKSTTESTREAREKHERSTPIHKNCNNDNNCKNIEAKSANFKSEVFTDANINQYGEKMLQAFFDYWSEPNRSNTKLKMELKPTWKLSGRLATWKSREIPSKNQSQSGGGVNGRIYREI